MIFPINKSKYKILKEIYNNPGIKVSELCKLTKVSSKVCYTHLTDLKNSEIIKEVTIGEKPQIRVLYPNLEHENGRLMFTLLEIQKKLEFYKKYKELKGCFSHLVANLPKYVLATVVFGSYARFAATKESDLDLLFIVSSKKDLSKLEELVEEAFVTFGKKVSSRILTKKEFLSSKKIDSLIKSIIKEHVCIYNPLEFLRIISG